jgi:hypothetical protein
VEVDRLQRPVEDRDASQLQPLLAQRKQRKSLGDQAMNSWLATKLSYPHARLPSCPLHKASTAAHRAGQPCTARNLLSLGRTQALPTQLALCRNLIQLA